MRSTQIILLVIIFMFAISKGSNAAPSSSEAANMARFLYYLVAGPPSTGYPDNFDGPQNGLVGIIAEVTGDNALGGGLKSAGYKTCADVPSSGSVDHVETDATFTMTFAAATKSIPAGWSGGGSNFDKRVEVAYNGTSFMVAEMSCSASSATGYLRMNVGVMDSSEPRNFETYYQFDNSTGRREIQFYMDYAGSYNERFAVIFSTATGSQFELYAIRGATQDSNSGVSVGLHGDFSSKKAKLVYVDDQVGDIDDTTLIADGTNIYCLNMDNDADQLDCSDLAISNPTPLDIVSAWTIGGVYGQSQSALE